MLDQGRIQRRRRILMFTASWVGVALGGFAAPAMAADAGPVQVETIVVTASKRPQDVQDVPMSVSAFSGDQLEKANITDATDLAHLVPGLTIATSNNTRNSSIIIRNIGSSGTNPGIEPSVGVFLDGVYMPSSLSIFTELTDISTIETLRGPQGTLYGRNTPVGAINVTTKAPTQGFEGMVSVGLGNYDKRRVAGYVNGGLTDTLAGRLSFWSDTRDGYVRNIYFGSNTNSQDQWGVRGRLRWTPDDLTTVDAIAYFSKTMTHCCVATQVNPYGPGGIATAGFLASADANNPGHPFVATGDFEVNSATEPTGDTPIYGVSLQATRKLPFNAELTNILAGNTVIDRIQRLAGPSVPIEVQSQIQKQVYRTYSDELRLSSTGKNRIDYVVGLYLFGSDLAYLQNATLLEGANRVVAGGATFTPGDNANSQFSQTTKSAAVFGQATWNVTDALRVTGGLRYSYDHKKAEASSVSQNIFTGGAASPLFGLVRFPSFTVSGLKRTEDSTTWSAGVQYDVAPRVMVYLTAGSGFKNGGFNARATSAPWDFGPERSQTYEVGVKSRLFDGRMLLNADVFQMELKDYQLSTLNAATGTGFVVGNAGDAKISGLEMDMQARPLSPLSITGNLSWTRSEYSDYPAGPCISTYTPTGSSPPPGAPQPNPLFPKSCDYTGYPLAYAPRLTGALHARWEQPFRDSGYNWFVSGGASYTGGQYLDATLDPRSWQGAYALYDASFGFEADDGAWRLSVWGKNLGNKAYFVNETAQLSGAYISAGGTAAANGYVGWYGAPRTFGVELSHKF
ncbi:TonB-dependent receptor [Phenylobacterium sp.]|uniref:TonB-dependent receptor n=1 Tax=Phenylobacterium sp. TaxID=1871053 RepID=UPI0035B33A96